LEKVCEMLAGVGKDDGEFETAVDVAVAIVRGFGTARNLHSFVRRWHAELARAGKDMARRVWFSRRLREGRSPLVAELETRLSPQQVVGLVGHISAHKDAAAVVVAATLADGLAGETYVDTVGTQLYDVVAPHLEVDKGRGVVAAQAWRVVAHTAGWSTADAAAAMWAAQGKQLKRVLKKASAAGDECAREAFQAAGALWRALYPDGEAVEEVQDVVVGYLGKMGGGAAVPAWEEWKKNGEGHEGGDDAGDLGWVLYGPARVAELLPHSLGEFPIAMAAAATKGGGNVAAGLLANQVLADDTSTMRELGRRAAVPSFEKAMLTDRPSTQEPSWTTSHPAPAPTPSPHSRTSSACPSRRGRASRGGS
jgi:nucleolar pre-ribosomal-associated protein 2